MQGSGVSPEGALPDENAGASSKRLDGLLRAGGMALSPAKTTGPHRRDNQWSSRAQPPNPFPGEDTGASSKVRFEAMVPPGGSSSRRKRRVLIEASQSRSASRARAGSPRRKRGGVIEAMRGSATRQGCADSPRRKRRGLIEAKHPRWLVSSCRLSPARTPGPHRSYRGADLNAWLGAALPGENAGASSKMVMIQRPLLGGPMISPAKTPGPH